MSELRTTFVSRENSAANEQERRAADLQGKMRRHRQLGPAFWIKTDQLARSLLVFGIPEMPQQVRQPLPQQPGRNLPRAVQRGVLSAFSNTCHRWQFSEAEQYVLLGFGNNPFLGEEILYGRVVPPQDSRDRAALVVSISIGLGALFNEDIAAERNWIATPRPTLGNRTPRAYMLDGRMLNIMKVLSEVEKDRGL